MNYRLFELVNGWAGRSVGVDGVMRIAAGQLIDVVVAAAVLFAGVEIYRRRGRQVARAGTAVVLAAATGLLLGRLSREPHPFRSHPVHLLVPAFGGTSMPSGHATLAFALALAIGAFLHRGWGVALGVAGMVIGFAQVWVGAFYPGDVLAGLIIAVLSVAEVALWIAVSHGHRHHPASAGAR